MFKGNLYVGLNLQGEDPIYAVGDRRFRLSGLHACFSRQGEDPI